MRFISAAEIIKRLVCALDAGWLRDQLSVTRVSTGRDPTIFLQKYKNLPKRWAARDSRVSYPMISQVILSITSRQIGCNGDGEFYLIL
jgi:hypothetical protein